MPNKMTQQAVIESRSYKVRRIPMLRPLGWLARGWGDLMNCPVPGFLHGVAAALWGALIVVLAADRFWLLIGAFSGFLLVAPVVATGLYAISRALERGEQPDLSTALRAWKPNDLRLVVFGLLLALAGTGWVLTSAALIWTQSGASVRTPMDFLRLVVLAPHGALFETWMALGAVLAAPVFASSVVTLPLLLDRQVGVLTAIFVSWKTIMTHPAPMALWAFLLLTLSSLGMLSVMVGLVVVVPWLAHASWHAYRDLVDTSGMVERH
jgi:uncharacterized membrane protein